MPDFVLEAVDALPDEESWDLIRAYLDNDACDRFVHELLPKMEMGQLKKMLATLKPFARDAYKAAMATREGKDAAAARKVVRSLFEHITSGDILSAYAKATKPG